MSDYDYEEEYQYEQEPAEQENIETKVELEYFQIQDKIRKSQWDDAIKDLQTLFVTCQENNLKNYKVKILNQLLQIYCKNVLINGSLINNIKDTLNSIKTLNQQQKYTENSVKSIISILRNSKYSEIKGDVINFIQSLDISLKLKCYLLLLDRAIEEKNIAQCNTLFDVLTQLFQQTQNVSATVLVQFYSAQVKFSKQTGTDISDKIHEIELQIPKLQREAYMSEAHISVLKLAIAEMMYEYGNYMNSALYISQSFLQKAKYGNSAQLKELLKVNVLLSLLISDPKLRKDQKYNSLYNDISIPFKNQKDVQALITLVDSYEKHDLELFQESYRNINFKPESQKYLSIYEKLMFNLKKQKLLTILPSYKTIKFSYISKRFNLDEASVQKMVYDLIVDDCIRGRINTTNSKSKYLQIKPLKNEFLETQTDNLRQLSKRYLV